MNSYNEFEQFLKSLKTKPKLLLHSCCAPCSTSVLELLTKYFTVDVYYYNPNIYPESEYNKREKEQERLIKKLSEHVGLIKEEYNEEEYQKEVIGLEQEKEGGLRCKKCIELRMKKACIYAKKHNYDYYTTYLYSDFKKKDGYKQSIILSNKYNLYRQDYCGCKYSVRN